MQKVRIAASFMAAALAFAVLPAGGAVADEGTGTHVDAVSASVSGDFVTVSGSATFVDSVIEVGIDGTGDTLQPMVGSDVAAAKINRPVGSNTLFFTYEVADMPGGQTVPGVVYTWPLMVDNTDNGLFLMGSRVGGIAPCPATAFCASLMQSGADGFSTVTRLSGATGADGEVTFPVPLSRLGVGPTQSGVSLDLGGGAPAGTLNGANEIVYCCAAVDTWFGDPVTIPAASVKLGIAPAGTPDDLVALTASGNVNAGAGSFTGILTAPTEPGEYKIVAEACYAAGDCGRQSATFTV